eukprot:137900-Chlamydomonas_euryale.AAC.1
MPPPLLAQHACTLHSWHSTHAPSAAGTARMSPRLLAQHACPLRCWHSAHAPSTADTTRPHMSLRS